MLIIVCNSVSFVHAENTLKVCLEDGYWYPFTYVEDGKPLGVHLDVVREAVNSLGMDIRFVSMPWARCLKENELGRLDGVIGVSYQDERAEYLHFPVDAVANGVSIRRIMQVEYVVVTVANSNYEFNGDINSIPAPILVPKGYSVGIELREQGLIVDDSERGDIFNINKLIKDKRGSVVVIRELVEFLSLRDEYKGRLKISKKAIMSKSYFLAFSKKSKLSIPVRHSIWDSISSVRDNSVLMEELLRKY